MIIAILAKTTMGKTADSAYVQRTDIKTLHKKEEPYSKRS